MDRQFEAVVFTGPEQAEVESSCPAPEPDMARPPVEPAQSGTELAVYTDGMTSDTAAALSGYPYAAVG
jgi:hypothetical protein